MWKVLYLVSFLGGLALAVHAMLHGIGRWRRRRSAAPSPALNPPTVAALAAGIGATGYLLNTRSGLGAGVVLLISLLVGAASLSGMIVLMAKWALRHDGFQSLRDEEDINGQVAMVTRAIRPDEPGEITWSMWERERVLPAQSLDGEEVPIGTEVVIDTVENGIAHVELWSVVENRL
jgi:hypothetical protein